MRRRKPVLVFRLQNRSLAVNAEVTRRSEEFWLELEPVAPTCPKCGEPVPLAPVAEDE